MLGFKVNVQKDDKTAELEIQGFTDQETAEGFANEVQETLLVCKDENEEITGFEVGRPRPHGTPRGCSRSGYRRLHRSDHHVRHEP